MRVVYIDSLFGFNFCVDYILLYIASSVARLGVKEIRLLLGAGIGALGACLAYFTPAGWGGAVNAAVIAASGLAVFGKRGALHYAKLFTLLLAVSFAFGGGVYALCSLLGGAFSNGVGYVEIPVGRFVLVFSVLYFPIKLSYSVYNKKAALSRRVIDAAVTLSGREFNLKLLSDTGCSLKDPVTGRPVMIVSNSELCALIEKKKEKGVAIIPYSSLGAANGMLYAVPADRVSAGGRVLRRILLASAEQPLSTTGEFDAVLQAQALCGV